MNEEVKKLWVNALRSGKYKQAKSTLRNNYGYCCLGVLCDLYDPNKWEHSDFVPETRFSYLYMTSLLPTEVVQWAGLNRGDPIVEGSSLSCYNDGHDGKKRHSFQEIADLIERHL